MNNHNAIFGNGGSTLTIKNSTIVNNTGDYNIDVKYATLNISSSIVAGNRLKLEGTSIVNSGGYNLYTEDSYREQFIGTGDITTTTLSEADINGLFVTNDDNSLAFDYHGGVTKTLVLAYGSAAIDAGNPSDTAYDQHGKERNGVADIGAFEYYDISEPVVSEFIHVNTVDTQQVSIEFNRDLTVVDLNNKVSIQGAGQTIAVAASVITISDNTLTINLPDADALLQGTDYTLVIASGAIQGSNNVANSGLSLDFTTTSMAGITQANEADSLSTKNTQINGDGNLEIGKKGWADYSVEVPTAGTYTLELRVAGTTGSNMNILVNGIEVVNRLGTTTGSDWEVITTQVTFSEGGSHNLKLLRNSGTINIDWFNLIDTVKPETEAAIETSSIGSTETDGVVITFDEEIREGSLTEGVIIITDAHDNEVMTLDMDDITLASDAKSIIADLEGLTPGTTYKAVLTAGAFTDSARNQVDSTTLEFTTAGTKPVPGDGGGGQTDGDNADSIDRVVENDPVTETTESTPVDSTIQQEVSAEMAEVIAEINEELVKSPEPVEQLLWAPANTLDYEFPIETQDSQEAAVSNNQNTPEEIKLNQLFNDIDSDDSGSVDKEEFKSVLKQFNDEQIDAIDADGDGMISLEELRKFLKKLQESQETKRLIDQIGSTHTLDSGYSLADAFQTPLQRALNKLMF